jgi:hypothetical protein
MYQLKNSLYLFKRVNKKGGGKVKGWGIETRGLTSFVAK